MGVAESKITASYTLSEVPDSPITIPPCPFEIRQAIHKTTKAEVTVFITRAVEGYDIAWLQNGVQVTLFLLHLSFIFIPCSKLKYKDE